MTSVSKLRRENYFCGLRQRDPLRFSDEALASGTRVAARIEYHGGGYHGWQAQPHLNVATVQGERSIRIRVGPFTKAAELQSNIDEIKAMGLDARVLTY